MSATLIILAEIGASLQNLSLSNVSRKSPRGAGDRLPASLTLVTSRGRQLRDLRELLQSQSVGLVVVMVAHGVLTRSHFMFSSMPMFNGINFSTCALKLPITMDYTRKA